MPGVKTMYNLEVAHDHTFVVGVGMWVVHNCGGGFDRSVRNVDDLDSSVLNDLEPTDGTINAGRSGGDRPLTGTPSTYAHTTGGHALVYDDKGDLIYDVSREENQDGNSRCKS